MHALMFHTYYNIHWTCDRLQYCTHWPAVCSTHMYIGSRTFTSHIRSAAVRSVCNRARMMRRCVDTPISPNECDWIVAAMMMERLGNRLFGLYFIPSTSHIWQTGRFVCHAYIKHGREFPHVWMCIAWWQIYVKIIRVDVTWLNVPFRLAGRKCSAAESMPIYI